MTLVLDHRQPFARLRSFISEYISHLRDTIECTEREVRMWEDSEVVSLVEGGSAEFREWGHVQSVVAQMKLNAAKQELAMLRAFYDSMDICLHCQGHGEGAVVGGCTFSNAPCQFCGGSGRRKQ